MKSARKCCAKTDELANRFESDLFNLRPAEGEINGDRSNRRYEEIADEARRYGSCDFEFDFANKLAEPQQPVGDDITRVVFFMQETGGLSISAQEQAIYQHWSIGEPVNDGKRDLAEGQSLSRETEIGTSPPNERFWHWTQQSYPV